MKQWVLRFFLLTVSVIVSVAAARYFEETIFFDKFIYYKSMQYGYFIPGKKLTAKDFGDRGKDIVSLDRDISDAGRQQVLGISNDTYTIALIGDSYVWGQGVHYADTISQLLEKKLIRYRKTRVLALANPGDSIVDYVLTFNKARLLDPIDLYVFVLVDNDLLLNTYKKNEYEKLEFYNSCIEQHPKSTVIYNFDGDFFDTINALGGWKKSGQSVSDQYADIWKKSWKSDTNLCLLENSLSALDAKNSIFFISQYSSDSNWALQTYATYLKKHGKKTIFFDDSKKLKQFASDWKNPDKNFVVSVAEQHPSTKAHDIFSELLVNEIITNTSLGFVK